MKPNLKWRASSGFLLVGAIVGAGASTIANAGTTDAVSTFIVPAQLSMSAGLNPSAGGWSLVSASSSPLWFDRGGQTGPFSSSSLGLIGGLEQSWVTSDVSNTYGIGQNLILPVPLSFAQMHPGPIELTVRVLSFSNPSSPNQLLSSKFYTHIGNPGVILLNAGSINGGIALRIDSNSNDGLSEYEFQWTSSSAWMNVSIAGYGMSIDSARNLALSVAN